VQSFWPIFSHSEEPGKVNTKLLPLYHREALTIGDHTDVDWGVLILLFGGSDPEEGDYFALFPVGGVLRGLINQDEIRFFLFPLYVDSRRDGYESTNFLWPLVSWGGGEGRRHFRILPFYSASERDGRRWSTTILWPFLTWRAEDLHTEHPSRSFFFFPFYGQKDSDRFWSRTYLYPLFGFVGGESGWSEQVILWPIFRRAELPGKYRALRVWPFFGYEMEGGDRDRFYLWPLVRDLSLEEPGGGRARSFRIAPFWWTSSRYDESGEEREAQFLLWPLFRQERGEDGSRMIRALALIPFLGWEDWKANYSWAWTLWSSRRDADGGGDWSAALGLLSWEGRGGEERTHFMKGLLGWETSAEGDAIRLLWLLRIPL
jgi:hypothetical protein